MKIGEMVSEFHELFQHPIAVDVTPELLELRAGLIREEAVDEAAEAVERRTWTRFWTLWPMVYTLVLAH
ncbi:hypothetical protein [Klebsiella pneumoniae]|uniref:hypothetical protein n=1 Tax=Klebsiella pneumoniae TaxID=573 RepID=UPI00296EA59F|nr:hypothetical protein [Klebsiella pneumoniae]MDW3810568.1 hypothetical protein [Klebsiella pneumoniae]